MKDLTPIPPTHTDGAKLQEASPGNPEARVGAVRQRLAGERPSVTHRFSVGGHKGYLTVGMFPDGEPGEIFITMAKEGSSASGLVSCFAQVVSVALQHGVPLEVFCEKFAHTRFEPSGPTGNPEIPMATSIMDYIFRWLRLRFIDKDRRTLPTPESKALAPHIQEARLESVVETPIERSGSSDAPFCVHCGTLTTRIGSCFTCGNCGAPTGCS